MNIIELQDNLKDVSDNVLMREMQSPSGNMPQFLVLSELTRRRRMRDDYKRQQAANMPTVAEEVMTASGAPQEGLTAIARNMAPNSSIAQNTSADMAVQREPTRMPQMMADGGILNLFRGGRTKEDMYTQVEPYPENDPDFRKRRDWNLKYGMTHNLDGSPKRMPPSTVDFDAMSDDISDAEQNRIIQQEVIDNNIPELRSDQPLPGMPQADPETNLDMSGALGVGGLGQNLADAMNNPIGDLPFLPPPTRDTREPSSPTDATIGSYGRTTVGQTADEIERMNQMLDLAGIGPSTAGDIISSAIIEEQNNTEPKESTLSGDNFSNDPTQGYSYPTDVPPVDPSMEGMTVLKRLAEVQGGSLPEDIYGGYTDPEAIARRQQRERMLELEPLGEGMQKDVPTVLSEADQVSQAGVIPEMPIDPSSVMPPVLRDLDVTDSTIIEDTAGDQGNVGSMMPTGGDSYGALESRIAKMLADREKSAESDKWLALAQAGMALMASDKPTLGAALGEAGLVGISQMREARNQYDKDILGLLSTQADIDAARRDASLAERRLGLQEREVDLAEEELRSTSGLTSKKLNEMIDDNRAYLNTLQSEAKSYRRVAEGDEALGTIDRVIDMTPPDLKAKIIAVSERLQELERMRSGQNVQFDATATQ